MKIAVGCDHAGFPLKGRICKEIEARGHQLVDLGAFDEQPTDYPDFAKAVGEAVTGGRADRGVLICGSGVGASIAANKVRGARAALCHDSFSARQGVEDDDMNVLCIGARVIGSELATEVLDAFLRAAFSGAERHRRRLSKVIAIEQESCGPGATSTPK